MAAPRKDNVPAMILQATEELLQTHALADISLAQIARQAGISKGTLYYHFHTKEDILLNMTDAYLDRQWQDLIAWTEDPSKDTSLHRLVSYVAQRDLSTVTMRMHLYHAAMLGSEVIRQRLTERYNAFAALIAEKIRERTDGLDAELFAWLILTASDGLFIQQMLRNDTLHADDFIQAASNLIQNTLE